MAGSLNRAELVGHLGQDPVINTTQGGNKIANLSVATSESWRDKQSGERREKTEWHRVVIFSEGLAKVAENYLKKGSKVFVSGKLQTREWEKDGVKRYSTEIILQGFDAKLLMLDGKSEGGGSGGGGGGGGRSSGGGGRNSSQELDDDVPF